MELWQICEVYRKKNDEWKSVPRWRANLKIDRDFTLGVDFLSDRFAIIYPVKQENIKFEVEKIGS